ncbi:MAG: hypothetical protein E6R03_06665 [Hyphomicrobiaceae bacterium]|nr:MAG: hypothetical protein E6R03_06665 [Hyphomicrobiaceae bacterium]
MYLATVCQALNLTRDQARHELLLFDGLRQLHLARLVNGRAIGWPEVEAQERRALKDEIMAAFT